MRPLLRIFEPKRGTRLMMTRTAAVAFVGVASLALSGCTSARNALGTNSSPCFLAIPVAKDAVHDRGSFTGVRLYTAKELSAKTKLLGELQARAGGVLKDVCVVGYRGTYTLDQVAKPIGNAPAGGVGKFAVVVVSRSSNQLIGTFVRARLPVPFHHVALGRFRG